MFPRSARPAILLAVFACLAASTFAAGLRAQQSGDASRATSVQDGGSKDANSKDGAQQQESQPAYETVSRRGKVVWLAEALKRRYGIEVDPAAAEKSVALETADGQVIPLVEDSRGRGFLEDERLRDVPMELRLRIYEQSPVAQIVKVYTLHDGAKFELDYWCDICAISMYELKLCECCQGPTRLRERKVDEDE